ncbi:MAG TPA: TrkA C-terminal domain-containing protein, partial [Gemmatimonadales bacterium]|nr:TrkA C-terminal domain-containing protein [Gemmatimonadales bacterium]
TLQAALAALGTDEPAVGYSVAYPFGVAGPILLLYLYVALLKPVIQRGASRRAETLEVEVRNPVWVGRRYPELALALPASVQVAAIREGQRTMVPGEATVLDAGDVLLLVGTDPGALDAARRRLGAPAPGEITKDRADLDYVRLFASSAQVTGRTLAELAPALEGASVLHVRRGDADLMPSPGVVLEAGDRVGLLVPRADVARLQAFFGDSIKSTADISYVSVGVGAALGLAAGLVSIPVPGVGRLALGFAGTLLVALTLGRLRRTAGLTWTLPLPANLVLRNFGLTLFLAQVGLASGPRFVETVRTSGLGMLVLGVLLMTVLVVSGMLAARLFRLP